MTLDSDSVDDICVLVVDTLEKAGADGYMVGVSDGVDSALVAPLCRRAGGSFRVRGLFLPGAGTPYPKLSEVTAMSDSPSIRLVTILIGPIIDRY